MGKAATKASSVDPLVGQNVWFFEHTANGGRYEHVARVESMLPDGRAILSFHRAGDAGRTTTDAVPEVKAGHVGSGWVRR